MPCLVNPPLAVWLSDPGFPTRSREVFLHFIQQATFLGHGFERFCRQ